MIIYYLYVKTHNKTGLQYLGYTSSVDPHKYTGSGKYWLLHLNKHGFDFSTRVLHKCVSKLAIKAWGLFYSRLWSIVNSKQWANLKEENGDGGDCGPKGRVELSRKGKGREHSDLTKHKMSDSHTGTVMSEITKEKIRLKNAGKKHTDAFKNLHRGSKNKFFGIGPFNGKTHSIETRKKISVGNTGKKHTEETRLNISKKMTGIKMSEVTCPHCYKLGAGGAMKQLHFDNCKSKKGE